MKYIEDICDWGLGGSADKRDVDVFSFCLTDSPVRMVEADEDDIEDSRTADSPRSSRRFEFSSVCRRVTGGTLLCIGLACLNLEGVFVVKARPGECDDIEVGVEVMLKEPGDSEYLVEGLADNA